MKNILTLANLLIFISVFPQQTVSHLEDPNYGQPSVYYADLNNILDSFTGTYEYLDGTTSLKISMLKRIHTSVNNIYWEDTLIGGYRYVENGIEKVNSLPVGLNTYSNSNWYTVSGNFILTGKARGCDDCLPDEKWLILSILDPISGAADELFVRKFISNNQEAIKIFIYHSIINTSADVVNQIPISYPVGQEFILIKQ